MLPNNPGGLSGFADQIREVMISANLISANPNDRIPANFAKQMDTIKQG